MKDTWYVTGTTENFDAETFAKAALKWATENGVSADARKTAEENDGTVTAEITGLDLGYYLVDTTMGSLCALTTTDPSATAVEKNVLPTVQKYVRDMTHDEDGIASDNNDDNNGEEFSDKDSADIGDTLEFVVYIKDVEHSSNLILHDELSKGFVLSTDSPHNVMNGLEIYVGTYTDGETSLEEQNISWTTVNSENYEVLIAYGKSVENPADNCDFEIKFSDEWLDTLSDKSIIKVVYQAGVGGSAESSNINEAWVSYGNNSESKKDTTETDIFGFSLRKTNDAGDIINNAKFTLTDENGRQFEFGESSGYYAVARPLGLEAPVVTTDIITVGTAEIFGLEAGKYILSETESPDGYNRLTYNIAIKIDDEGKVYYFNMENGESLSDIKDTDWITITPATENENTVYVITVINSAGQILPSTGGTGTLMFYLVGGIFIAGAGIIFITRKRFK